MRPSHFQDLNAKRETNINGLCPPPLKINKESHMVMKKTSTSSSVSSSSSSSPLIGSTSKAPQRHPVIIYTHSPKVIHTHPKDFMALVQKLTGLSRGGPNDEEITNANPSPSPPSPKPDVAKNDDNESSSVITTDHENNTCGGISGSDSCFVNSPFIPNFMASSTDFLNQGFYGYTDPLYFGSSIASSSSLEGIDEFNGY